MEGQGFSPESGKVAIVSCGRSAVSDHRFARLAELAGLRPLIIEAPQSANCASLLLDRTMDGCDALVASDAALSSSPPHYGESTCDVGILLSRFRSVLLYASDRNERSGGDGFAPTLNGNALARLLEIGGDPFQISLAEDLPDACSQLRGLSLLVERARPGWRAFDLSVATKDPKPLLSTDGKPLFMRCSQNSASLFLLANSRILDLDEAVSAEGLTSEAYLELLPWLLFLRAAFGDRAWHNPNPGGCVIIDDPLLRPRYGFLRYDDLLAMVQAHDFAASIAFIPWNYRRSARAIVERFKRHSDRLSLCVHGSDHTGGEFRNGDEGTLRCKARTALTRMYHHEASTGLSFDRVMVFPQGGFNRAALRALQAENFLAAINTSVFPAERTEEHLKFRHLLQVALTSHGCPLFSRRYPDDLFRFAFDLFMGKPAFIVQHHGDFRQGWHKLIEFILALKRQDTRLTWDAPAKVIEQTFLTKRVGPREEWILFYADALSFQNGTGAPITYRLHRPVRGPNPQCKIELNGKALDFAIRDSTIIAETILAPGERARLQVLSSADTPLYQSRNSAMYRAKVASRRMLSEFRDNYIARNEWLLAGAEGLKKFVQQTARM